MPENIPTRMLATYADVTDTPLVLLSSLKTGDVPLTSACVDWLNGAASDLLCAAVSDVVGRPLPVVDDVSADLLLRAARPVRHQIGLIRRDGSTRAVAAHLVPVGGGTWLCSLLIESRDAADALATTEERFRILVEKTPIATAFSDVGLRLGHVNDAMVTLFGAPASVLLGTGWLDRISPEHHDDFVSDVIGVLAGIGPVETSIALTVPERRIVDVRVAPVPLPRQGRGFVVTFNDVTEKRGLQEALEHQAHHDSLTGLPNRARLHEVLTDSLARGEQLAVAFVDLDNFKLVNDTLGHAAGDELLIRVADQLSHACRSADTVHRIGGDEFVVVARDIGDATGAAHLADRLTGAAFTTVSVAGAELHVSGSIGVVIADPNYDADTLLQHADIAMYQAKGAGKNRWRLFAVGDDELLTDQLRLSAQMRHLLSGEAAFAPLTSSDTTRVPSSDITGARSSDTTGARSSDITGSAGELELRYQPIVHLPSGRVAGLEALLRWHHPTLGELTAPEALTAAAESGTTADLTRWVLREALTHLADWDATTPAASRPFLTVNVDVHQLTAPGLVEDVASTLAATGIAPERLTIELTETTPMTSRSAATVVQQLRRVGVGIAIDDFGTGYSSLAALTTLSVTLMKLDKSLLLATDDNVLPALERARLAAAIVGIGHALGLPVVAEGVTDHVVADMLADAGCHYAQGFLYARPAAAMDIPQLLSRDSLTPPRTTPRPSRGTSPSTPPRTPPRTSPGTPPEPQVSPAGAAS